MNPHTPARRGQVQPVLAVALGAVAIVAVGFAIVSRPSPEARPTASNRPSAPSSTAPFASPSTTPRPTPSAWPSAGIGSVRLRNATGHAVIAQVHDQTGALVSAASGTPGDGMSVRWHRGLVENAGPRTILVTWAGLPGDDTLDLGVAVIDGAYRVTIVQAGPMPYSDAMGEDRIVALTFDRPVSARDVSVDVLDRTVD